jgi:ankyrin repeat protein
MFAATDGCAACVTALLPVSDPLAVDARGQTALMQAAAMGHADCVRVLLPVSDPFAVDGKGRSALDLAEQHDEHDVAGMILSFGVAPGANDAP